MKKLTDQQIRKIDKLLYDLAEDAECDIIGGVRARTIRQHAVAKLRQKDFPGIDLEKAVDHRWQAIAGYDQIQYGPDEDESEYDPHNPDM